MAQQTIGIGTVANDGLGDPLRTAMTKTNDNFDEVYLTNVVHVNNPSDFPAAVGGVRELIPVGVAFITYLIAADDIDMGSDRFTVTDGQVVIRGTHRTASMTTTTATGNMFTCVDGSFFAEFINFDCVNAKVLDFSTPTTTFQSVVFDNVVIRDCDSLWTIDGAFTTSLRTFTVVSTQTGGGLWTGSDNSQINISNSFATDWTGTLFDLGTATFDIIDWAAGNRFVAPSGATILSGAAASANFNAGGRGLIDNTLFNGLGTALNVIDTEDLQWDFKNNIFADNSTKNTEVVTDAFLTSSKTVTVGGGNQGVYLPVGGVNWSTDISKRFTISTSGIAEYIGLETIDIIASVGSTVSKSGGGADQICSKIAIDTGSGFVVSDKTIGCTENTTPTGILSSGLFEIKTGDKIQLFVVNEGGTSDIIVANANMIIGKR